MIARDIDSSRRLELWQKYKHVLIVVIQIKNTI